MMQFKYSTTGLPAFLLSLFLAIPCLSQDSQTAAPDLAPPISPRFEHLTIADGLSQGMVNAIYQDSKGFIWFGSKDGLNRYDGYDFKVFRHDPFDSTSISGNYIIAVSEDHLGRLWVGTLKNGLNCFDPDSETFRRFTSDPANANSLSQKEVKAICEAPVNGHSEHTTLWIGTDNGLNKLVLTPNGYGRDEGLVLSPGLNRSSLLSFQYTFSHFFHDPNDSSSINSNEVLDVLVDRANVLWIATEKGLARLDLHPNATAKARFQRFVHRPEDPFSLPTNLCYRLYEDKQGALWVATIAGLSGLDAEQKDSGHFRNFAHDEGIFTETWRKTPGGVCEDRQGSLWTSHAEGVSIFDPESEQFQYIRHDPGDPFSLRSDRMACIFRDRNGIIWIGSAGLGVDNYDPRTKQFHAYTGNNLQPQPLTGFSITHLLQEPSGALWVLADDFYLFDLAQGDYKSHPLAGTSFYSFISPIRDQNGDIWSLQDYSLKRYNPESKNLESMIPLTREENFFPQLICEDSEGDIWMIGWTGAWPEPGQSIKDFIPAAIRFYQLQRKTHTISTYPVNMLCIKGDSENINFQKMYRDKHGIFWVATDMGLYRIDLASGACKFYRNDPRNPHSLNQNTLKTFLPDPLQPQRFLWVGTDGGGLNRFDFTTETFRHYTEKKGLPNNVVYGILADGHGNLWMSTNKGLSKAILHKETREIMRFKNYDARDGLQSDEFNTNAYFQNERGDMFFGGVNGFNYFHPDSIEDNPHAPPVVITDFQIRYKSVSPTDPDSPLQKVISETKEITLPYSDNVISFEFAALDYASPAKNLHSYKLDNLDQDWSTPSHDRKAIYTNLDPGEYVFRVRGSNNHGVWNEAGATIKITVTPPWWRTWWAYGLFFLSFFGVVYGAYRLELNRQRLKLELKQEQVLTEKKHLHAEKLQELDRMKSRFFANISHEFRTPLTLILGPLEKLLVKTRDRKSQQDLTRIQRSANQLLRLINQLLDLAKLETGKMQLQAGPGDFVSFLKGMVMSFESLAQSKGIALRFEMKGAPQPCEGSKPSQGLTESYFDRDKVEKIFSNLMSNAFKFTREAGSVNVSCTLIADCRLGIADSGVGEKHLIRSPQCEVCANRLNAGGGQDQNPSVNCVEITVKDTGIGIPADRLPHIFDRFYQASAGSINSSSTREHAPLDSGSQKERFPSNDDPTGHDGTGTGIGLALLKELVEVHHGSIEVESAEGRGTIFTVCLPLGKAHLRTDEIVDGVTLVDIPLNPPSKSDLKKFPFEGGAALAVGDGSLAHEINQPSEESEPCEGSESLVDDTIILVIEDNAAMREFIRDDLESDYKILEAGDGEQGVNIAFETIPDLVISDVMMPRKNGYQVCQQLKTDERTSHIPVILLTAKAEAEDKIEGLETGADDYLIKPFDTKQLKVRIQNLIELRRKLRQRFSKEITLKASEIAVTSADEKFLDRLLALVEAHLSDENFGVEQLAREIGMSQVQLWRKIYALVNQNSVQFIRSIRLQHAKRMLEENAGNVTEISYAVGFISLSHFAKCFKEQFGHPPSFYKSKKLNRVK